MQVIENRRLWETNQSYAIDGKRIIIRVEEWVESFDLSTLLPGEYQLEDCLILPYNPIEKIVVGEEIIVHLFYDNPYEYREDYVIPFSREQISYSGTTYIDKLRKDKEEEIGRAFSNAIMHGHFFSETFQMEVDCRRGGKDNDKQNVEGLIERFELLPLEKKYYKGVTETTSTPFTVEQLQSLKMEMTAHVHSLYEKKWLLEGQLEQATTLAELEQIKWEE